MMNLQNLKLSTDLHDVIDWEMTPEEAVRLYLEWGNNWANGNYVIRTKHDVSYYFVINTWGTEPTIYLIKRNEKEAEELAEIKLPRNEILDYFKRNGSGKGVFALDEKIKKWLKNELNSLSA